MQETTNYLQFKNLKANRDTNISHVNRLAKSIEMNGYIGMPILVSKNMEILDGQHRFEALKLLKRPIPFEIRESMSIKDIQALNAVSRTWGISDYIKSYSELGNESYQWFAQILKDHPDYFKPTSLAYLTDKVMKSHSLKVNKPHTGQVTNLIKEGKYVAYSRSIVDKIIEFKPDFMFITNKYGDINFIMSIGWVLRYVDIDFNEFLERCKQNRHLLEYGLPSSGLYLQEFEKIWNKGRIVKNHVNFFERGKDTCSKENLTIENNGN